MDVDGARRVAAGSLPGAQIESVPSVDLQTTIYVPRDDAAARSMRALRDGPSSASRCSPS